MDPKRRRCRYRYRYLSFFAARPTHAVPDESGRGRRPRYNRLDVVDVRDPQIHAPRKQGKFRQTSPDREALGVAFLRLKHVDAPPPVGYTLWVFTFMTHKRITDT